MSHYANWITDLCLFLKVMPQAPPGCFDLLKSQLKNCSQGEKDPRSHRWNSQVISMALGMYCRLVENVHIYR